MKGRGNPEQSSVHRAPTPVDRTEMGSDPTLKKKKEESSLSLNLCQMKCARTADETALDHHLFEHVSQGHGSHPARVAEERRGGGS